MLRNSFNTKFYYPSIKDSNIIALVALSGCIDFFRIPHIITFHCIHIMYFIFTHILLPSSPSNSKLRARRGGQSGKVIAVIRTHLM